MTVVANESHVLFRDSLVDLSLVRDVGDRGGCRSLCVIADGGRRGMRESRLPSSGV